VFAACVIDVALVIDCSGSIRDTNPPGVDNWQYVLNFTVDLITSINVGQGATRVGAVSFGRPLCTRKAVVTFFCAFEAIFIFQEQRRSIAECSGCFTYCLITL